MYPTFPKGKGADDIQLARQTVAWPKMRSYPQGVMIWGKRYWGRELIRGDIIDFENGKTREMSQKKYGREAGFVKRVIGLPDEKIYIRDGFVYVNDKRLDEPYTALPRSTFGGNFLADCKELIVPAGMIFVMGDNRKGSGDSRGELGLVAMEDVHHVLPVEDQGEFKGNWRDPSKDTDTANKPTLDKDEYLAKVNGERTKAGLKTLKFDERLSKSAQKRAGVILKFDDLSFEATRSGYTMEKALREVGYENALWGEFPALGYYTAEELFEYSFENSDAKKFLLDRRFQDTGIAVVVGEMNGCPAQVVVQHVAGYVPPNYKKEDIEGWKKVLSVLQEVQPEWKKLTENAEFYGKHKNDLDRLLEIIDIRIRNIQAIVARMEANLWLSKTEKDYVSVDQKLGEELNQLIGKLNP